MDFFTGLINFRFDIYSNDNFSEKEDYVLDNFKITPPMSTFTLGFVISQLETFKRTDFVDSDPKIPCIRFHGRSGISDELEKSVKV